jgi:hypothetical protein
VRQRLTRWEHFSVRQYDSHPDCRWSHRDCRATDDYRNQANHGFPRRIEYGYTPIIRRDPKSKQATFVEQGQNGEYQFIKLPGRSYDLYDSPPIPVIDLIPLLGSQHQAATGCYNKCVELITEQHKSWPTLTA